VQALEQTLFPFLGVGLMTSFLGWVSLNNIGFVYFLFDFFHPIFIYFLRRRHLQEQASQFRPLQAKW
jgi:hypothetical protein